MPRKKKTEETERIYTEETRPLKTFLAVDNCGKQYKVQAACPSDAIVQCCKLFNFYKDIQHFGEVTT